MEIKKGLHYSTEIEEAILGVCLLEANALGRIFGIVEPEYFYHSAHQTVFEIFKEMYKEGMMIDTLTVADYIRRIKKTETIGGHVPTYFLCRLTNSVVSGAHLEYHSAIIKAMWMEREIFKLSTSGVSYDGDTAQKIKSFQDKLYALQTKSTQNDWTDMTQLMVDLYRHQEEMRETKGIGLPTGLASLDRENGGFQNGQLVIIGARPSMGKSALLGGMAIEMAKRKSKIGIVSLEMSNNEIAARLVSYDTNTDFGVVFRGLYKDMEDAHRLYEKIANSTSELPIWVSDKTKVSVPEIRAKAEKLKSIHGLDCLMIDYLQLVTPVGGSYNKNRENEIAEMSRGCKIMAKELNIPVILLCQLNREVTKRKGDERYPQLSDLRESGSLEQDADVVMFLHRDFMVGIEQNENGATTEFEADLVVRKWRNGRTNFIVQMDFDPPKMKFTERRSNSFVPVSTESFSSNKNDENPF